MGRRRLLIIGHIAITILHAAVAVFDIAKMNYGVIVCVLLFLVAYEFTSGVVAWVYAAETTIDTGLGLCLLTLWGTVFWLSIVCPIIMDPASLGPTPVFFMFSGLSIGGTIYCFLFIKETMGLTDKQKKILYTPDEFLTPEERALRRKGKVEEFEESGQ